MTNTTRTIDPEQLATVNGGWFVAQKAAAIEACKPSEAVWGMIDSLDKTRQYEAKMIGSAPEACIKIDL